jgi:hypothetical protein
MKPLDSAFLVLMLPLRELLIAINPCFSLLVQSIRLVLYRTKQVPWKLFLRLRRVRARLIQASTPEHQFARARQMLSVVYLQRLRMSLNTEHSVWSTSTRDI